MPPDDLRPQDTRNKCWLTTLIICSAARTRLLISSVSARFIPAWFLDNPPSTISVWYRGNKCFSGLSRMVSPFKERVGFESFCPSRMQQLGNERSLYPRFYSMNTSACITQPTNLLDLKLDNRIFIITCINLVDIWDWMRRLSTCKKLVPSTSVTYRNWISLSRWKLGQQSISSHP